MLENPIERNASKKSRGCAEGSDVIGCAADMRRNERLNRRELVQVVEAMFYGALGVGQKETPGIGL